MLRNTVIAALSATLLSAAPALAHTTSHHKTKQHAKRHVVHRVVRHRAKTHAPAAQTAQPSATAAAAPVAPAVPATCVGTQDPAATTAPATLRAAVVCLINKQRLANGLPAVAESTKLDSSSQSWTDAMVAQGVFAHVTSSSNPVARIEATGYDWQALGENIATGFETPQQVVDAWMASPDHCKNILDPQYREVGTGVNPAPVVGAASAFATWTQDFGLSSSADAPSDNWTPANTLCHA
jgi:uncharacterized protein YkwD